MNAALLAATRITVLEQRCERYAESARRMALRIDATARDHARHTMHVCISWGLVAFCAGIGIGVAVGSVL